ncbi:hypothetical protein A1O7_08506 [Cladophialophora yegresii CBS 114405]|uniref:Telomere repeat-binding factor dimerisation domain-containing protein n=1 Tax=Cladophialophora yegresii CBS 114405 TaxID=1182544 RepID=W9VJA4_9EURO|nr:uncharacterized protein A1O7_08506 [Cladophialophora yegresii CBS 114405]EXJ55578.1 hypothetical protein A1O7_08506 [Cladophialophora yegresii CBS 114405]
MDQMSPTDRPAEAIPQASAPPKDRGKSNAPISTLTPSAPPDVDDNPRSPKRRRISTDGVAPDVKPETKALDSGNPTVHANRPASPHGQAPNEERKAPQEEQAGNATNVSKGVQAQNIIQPASGDQPQSAPRPPAGQAHNVASQPPQRPTPPRNSPLEYLPILDQQASQILAFLSRLSPADAMGLSTRPNAASSREYASLRAAFDRTRRLISPGWPFLPQHDLGLQDTNQIEIIRKANQAIFMSSIFTGEIGLRDMDRSFLPVFVPENGGLLKEQGTMFLELKTQGFITAWRTGAAPPDLVMRDMFGPDLDKVLLARRPGSTTLTDTEREFLRTLNSRRGILESAVKTKTLDQLPVTYKWEDFSREVSSYLINHIMKTGSNGTGLANVERNGSTNNLDPGQTQGHIPDHGLPAPGSSMGFNLNEPFVKEDFVALAARAAEIALQSTLGLSPSDKIPDMPSSNTPTAAAPPFISRDISTPQPAALESRISQTNKMINPSEVPTPEQKLPERQAPDQGSATGDISHASQTAQVKQEVEMATGAEERPVGIDTVESEVRQEAPVLAEDGSAVPSSEPAQTLEPS